VLARFAGCPPNAVLAVQFGRQSASRRPAVEPFLNLPSQVLVLPVEAEARTDVPHDVMDGPKAVVRASWLTSQQWMKSIPFTIGNGYFQHSLTEGRLDHLEVRCVRIADPREPNLHSVRVFGHDQIIEQSIGPTLQIPVGGDHFGVPAGASSREKPGRDLPRHGCVQVQGAGSDLRDPEVRREPCCLLLIVPSTLGLKPTARPWICGRVGSRARSHAWGRPTRSQSPTAGRPPPTADRRPPTAHRRPPTADRRPPTAHRPPPAGGDATSRDGHDGARGS
jgi:hypothetical protein